MGPLKAPTPALQKPEEPNQIQRCHAPVDTVLGMKVAENQNHRGSDSPPGSEARSRGDGSTEARPRDKNSTGRRDCSHRRRAFYVESRKEVTKE